MESLLIADGTYFVVDTTDKTGDRIIAHARGAYHEQTGEDGISLPDPVAMAIALDPSVGISWSSHYVDIETSSELTRGMSVIDRLIVAGNPRNGRF